MTGHHGGDHSDCAVCEAARTTPPLSEQMDQAWVECASCGVIGRKHPASGDHQFTPKLRVAQ